MASRGCSPRWQQSGLAGKPSAPRQIVNATETERHDPSLPLAFNVARLFKLPIGKILEHHGK